ncbi:hypothetical protein DI09_293p10, partial [Mitosporidium daphniae]
NFLKLLLLVTLIAFFSVPSLEARKRGRKKVTNTGANLGNPPLQVDLKRLEDLVDQKIKEVFEAQKKSDKAFKEYNPKLEKVTHAALKAYNNFQRKFRFLFFRKKIQEKIFKEFKEAEKKADEAKDEGLDAQLQLNKAISEARLEIQKFENALNSEKKKAESDQDKNKENKIKQKIHELKGLNKTFENEIEKNEEKNKKIHQQYQSHLNALHTQDKANTAEKTAEHARKKANQDPKNAIFETIAKTAEEDFRNTQLDAYHKYWNLIRDEDKKYLQIIKEIILSIRDQSFLMITTWALSCILYFVLFNSLIYNNILPPVIDYLSIDVQGFKTKGTWLQELYQAYTSEIHQKNYPFLSAFFGVFPVSLGLLLALKPKDPSASSSSGAGAASTPGTPVPPIVPVAASTSGTPVPPIVPVAAFTPGTPVPAAKYTLAELIWKISRLINFLLSYFGFWFIAQGVAEKRLTHFKLFSGDGSMKDTSLKPSMPISNLLFSAISLMLFYKDNYLPGLPSFLRDLFGLSEPENKRLFLISCCPKISFPKRFLVSFSF